MMHQERIWEEYLPLVEFAYNNGYQESLRMIPFKALYVSVGLYGLNPGLEELFSQKHLVAIGPFGNNP